MLLPKPKNEVDIVQINDITANLTDEFETLTAGETETSTRIPPGSEEMDYVVIDRDGKLLMATRRGLSEDVFSAIGHGDTIVDITLDGQVVGKAIFWNDADEKWQSYRKRLQICLGLIILAIAIVIAVFFFSMHRKILSPFQRMRRFAGRIAAGELDVPLEMDRQGAFGAFTESFDLMREELRISRENERAAEQSKRELVAALSHDIQTPVASIKAVAELMEVTAQDDQRAKLQTIQQKAGQINTLVTELFHTTLEELHSLIVTPAPFPSDRFFEIIEKADDRGKVQFADIPGCIVQADPVRLEHIIDNIIANSYKYADTKIDVSAEIDSAGFSLKIRDYGPGADPEELALLCSKYYRGKNGKDKNGYGLGLFIAKSLTERMGGRIECKNANPGFEVCVWLSF
jgi:signal transduction histidine kinase